MRGIPAKHYVAKSCNASKYLLVMPRCSTSFRSQCDHLAVWVHPPWRFRACLQPSDCISCLAAVSRHPSRKTLQVAVLCAQWVGTRSEWLLDKSRSAPSFYLSGGGVEGERDGKEGGGGSGSSFATSPISPAAQSLHILPSLPQSLSCISLSLMPCFALHFGPPPLLFPPNDVLFHKLFALLPLSFSARVVSCHVSFPCTLVGFLSHQTMSPHILPP